MRKYKVLYAEDDLSNRKIMEHKLKNIDIECITAVDGKEAVDLFHKDQFDIVILDKLMPNKDDGIKALHEMKKIDNHIKSMCLTSDDWDTDELIDAGFDTVFIKPIIGDSFTKELLKQLDK